MKELKPRKRNGYLEDLIIEKHGSQRKFADVIGTTPTIVSYVVNQRWNLTDEDKKLWATNLGDTVENIFGSDNA